MASKRGIKFKVSDKEDPLKQELLSQTIGQPKPKQLCRTMMPQWLWEEPKYVDFFQRFDRPCVQKEAHPMRVSRVAMDHYEIDRDAQTLNSEYPKGKRMEGLEGSSKRDMRNSRIFKPMEVKFPLYEASLEGRAWKGEAGTLIRKGGEPYLVV